MNKKQIIEALRAAGVEPDGSLTIEQLKALADEKGVNLTPSPSRPSLVTVKVSGQPVNEDGVTYLKEQTFETTLERAQALSHLVTLVEE